tara:strand:+ start:408 stop:2414 length:2007 start_codon:yes stop_codon:yes gene_type:complete
MQKKLRFSLNYKVDNNHTVTISSAQKEGVPSGYHRMQNGNVISNKKYLETFGSLPSYNAFVGKEFFVNTTTNDFFNTIAVVSFKAKDGYYYSSEPKISLSSTDRFNYTVEESVNAVAGNVFSKSFIIKYKATKRMSVGNINFSFELNKTDLGIKVINEVKKLATIEEKQALTEEQLITLEQQEQNIINSLEQTIEEQEAAELAEQQASVLNVEISSINFDKSILPGIGTTRYFTAIGHAKAKFHLSITRNSDSYTYDPVDQVFSSATTRFSNIPVTQGALPIVIPSHTNQHEIYKFEFVAVDSVYSGSASDTVFEVTQAEAATGTFAVTSTNSSGDYASVTSIELSNQETSATLSFDITVSASNKAVIDISPSGVDLNELNSNLFSITRTILTNDPADDFADTTTIKLDTVDGLRIGDGITGSSPFSVADGAQSVVSIDLDNNKITTSNNQNLDDNQSLTFTAQNNNSGLQYLSGGCSFEISDVTVTINDTTTTTDATSSSSKTVNVTSTDGAIAAITQTVDGSVASGNTVTLDSITGLYPGMRLVKASASTLDGEDTSDGISITSVNSTSKKVVVSRAQTFEDGETLTFGKTKVTGVGISGNPYVSTVSAGASVAVEPSNQTLESGSKITFSDTSKTAKVDVSLSNIQWGNYSYTATMDLDYLLTLA